MTKVRELISADYMIQNRTLHATTKWGGSGWKQAGVIADFAKELSAVTLLDYGCGRGTLKVELGKMGVLVKVLEYDPGIPKKAGLPYRADLVVCTDVLEHIEPDKLDAVLNHIRDLSIKGTYLAIATRPANKCLPDGRNAHLIIEQEPWWTARIGALEGWQITRTDDRRKKDGSGHEVRYWLKRA